MKSESHAEKQSNGLNKAAGMAAAFAAEDPGRFFFLD
jgi:hypothetical protein